jgi:SacI homology domain
VNPYRKGCLRPFEKITDPDAPPTPLDPREIYVWNTHNLQEFNKGLTAQEFILPVICGYFESKVLVLGDKTLHFGIISRR